MLGAVSAAFAFGLGDLAKSVAERTVEKAADPNTASKWDDLTLQQEIDIGDSVSVEIVARYGGIWKDKVATQRVNLVGKTLARYAKRDSLAGVSVFWTRMRSTRSRRPTACVHHQGALQAARQRRRAGRRARA
jgi:hypothetical protein